MSQSSRDLEGLLVVSLEQAVAAPYASGRLAAAGARVIKVERSEGDFARRYDRYAKGLSAYFVWLNGGKESLRLDLRDAEDHALLLRILGRADVFIQNMAPDGAKKLGLGTADLRARHPGLITCDISGYGESGPYRTQKAYDLLVQAETGLVSINGTPEGPARVGISVCDIAAGMNAHQAILQALFARTRTGEGRAIEVSLYHALADWMNVPSLQYAYGSHEPKRSGVNHPTIAPYGAYLCGDGKALVISIQNETEWVGLCTHLLDAPALASDQRFATNPDRVRNRPALDALLSPAFARQDREAAIALLEKARVAYGRLSTLEDLLHHPQNRLRPVETESGDLEVLDFGARVAGEPPRRLRVPALGQHDEAIRAEFAA